MQFKEYNRLDTDNSGGLEKNEWIEYCRAKLGDSHKVIIKFMLHEEQYNREFYLRTMEGGLNDPQYIVGLLPSPDPALFKQAVSSLVLRDGRSNIDLSPFKYGIVIPSADRNLDTIFRLEQPDLSHIKVIATEVANCLKYCHDNPGNSSNKLRVTHGDLKMSNILRVNNKMKLIDFDSAAIIMSEGLLDGEYSCAKFCTGILAPEYFYSLKDAEEEKIYREVMIFFKIQ